MKTSGYFGHFRRGILFFATGSAIFERIGENTFALEKNLPQNSIVSLRTSLSKSATGTGRFRGFSMFPLGGRQKVKKAGGGSWDSRARQI